MEKLQPIIAQKFWILTGIAVILPFVGWWMASGALATQIDERTEKIERVGNTIPTGEGAMNPRWSAVYEKGTEKQKHRNSLSLTMLEKSQIDLRKWPLDVATVMAVCRYRGSIIKTTDIINDDNSLTAEQLKQLWNRAKNTPFEYVHEYPHEIARLWEIVDPMDDDSSDSRLDSKKKKKVMMAYKLIPQAKGAPWEGLPPTWNEMWDAQEDIWFLEDLFRAVARVNSDADNIVEAHIKKVMSVKLFGGERAVSTKTTDAPKKTGDAYIDSGAGNLGNLARANTKGATATFPLEEEFIESSSRTAQTAMPGATNGTNKKASTEPPKIKRYVDEGEDFAFRTRGFVMSVIINEQRVPEFLVELTNSRWPIEIRRVQQVVTSGTFSINQTFSPTKSGGASFGPDNSGASDGGFIDPSSGTDESDGNADDGSTFEDPDESSSGGGGGTGGAGVSVGAAPGSSGEDFIDPGVRFTGPQRKSAKGASNITQSALDDKMLVHLVVCGLFKAYDPPSKEAIAAMLAKAQAAAGAKTPVPNPVAPVTPDPTAKATNPATPNPNPPPIQPQTSDTGATSKTDAASKTGDTDAASKTGDTESQPPKTPAEPNGKNGNTDNSASDKPTTPPKPNPPQPNS